MPDTFDLVPQAQRLDIPAKDQEFYHDTIWYNPTERDVILDLYVGNPTPTPGRPPKSYEQRTGHRKYKIPAKSTHALPREFDKAVQHTQCLHDECLGRPVDCRNPEHPKQIIGGLGPQLINRGERTRPVLAPALDDLLAREEAARKAAYEAWQMGEQAKASLTAANADRLRVEQELAAKKAELEALQKQADSLAMENSEQALKRSHVERDAQAAAAVEATPHKPQSNQSRRLPQIQG